MVNLDKWEEIGYGDINEGDDIKVVTTADTGKIKTQTITRGKSVTSGYRAWYSDSIRVVNDPDGKDSRFTHVIYRRKPKPFTFPTNNMAVIKGDRIGYDNVTIRFVKTGGGWFHQSGSDYTEDMIRQYFHNFTVEFEGVK